MAPTAGFAAVVLRRSRPFQKPFDRGGSDLRRHDIEPQVEAVEHADGLPKGRAVALDRDLHRLDLLRQGRQAKLDIVECGLGQGRGRIGLGIADLIGRIVQHRIRYGQRVALADP